MVVVFLQVVKETEQAAQQAEAEINREGKEGAAVEVTVQAEVEGQKEQTPAEEGKHLSSSLSIFLSLSPRAPCDPPSSPHMCAHTHTHTHTHTHPRREKRGVGS